MKAASYILIGILLISTALALETREGFNAARSSVNNASLYDQARVDRVLSHLKPFISYTDTYKSSQGRPIKFFAYGNTTSKRFLINACQHGNEPGCGYLFEGFMYASVSDPAFLSKYRGYVIVFSNPDGMHRYTRENGQGLDMNRNWPSGTHETKLLSQRISYTNVAELDVTIDFHSLAGKETNAYVEITPTPRVDESKVCALFATYLPRYRCLVGTGPSSSSFRSYYASRGVPLNMVIEPGQYGRDPRQIYEEGKQIKKILERVEVLQ